MDEFEVLTEKVRQAANGGWGVLSTGEKLAAALALNRPDWLTEMGYTIPEAMDRVGVAWLSMIPGVVRLIEETNDLLSSAADRARKEEQLASLSAQTQDGSIDLSAKLLTYGESPGYRDVSVVFEVRPIGAEGNRKLSLRLSPRDGATLACHIIEVHRFAWGRGQPIDIEPGELRPTWIG